MKSNHHSKEASVGEFNTLGSNQNSEESKHYSTE